MAVDPPLLCSPCSIFGQSLWWSRALLHPTYIELSGWSWTGRIVRRIPLSAIQHVRWWGGKEDINLELTLESGALVALYLEESAGTWNYTLRRLRASDAESEASTSTVQHTSSSDASPERTTPHRVGIAPT